MRSGVLLATTLAATLCSPAPSLPSFPCHPPPASAAGREIPAHCADHLWLDQFAIPPAWRTVPPLVQLPDTLPACRKARCPALCPRSLAAPPALSKLSPPLPAGFWYPSCASILADITSGISSAPIPIALFVMKLPMPRIIFLSSPNPLTVSSAFLSRIVSQFLPPLPACAVRLAHGGEWSLFRFR